MDRNRRHREASWIAAQYSQPGGTRSKAPRSRPWTRPAKGGRIGAAHVVARQEGTVANIGDYFRQQLGVRDKLLYRHFESGQWRDVSAGEVGARIGRWQAALVALGLSPGDRVAICLHNGVEWVALDLAALGLGLVVVPLYVDDNPDNIAWCVTNAEAHLLVVEGAKMADALKATGSALPPIYVQHADAGDATATVASLL